MTPRDATLSRCHSGLSTPRPFEKDDLAQAGFDAICPSPVPPDGAESPPARWALTRAANAALWYFGQTLDPTKGGDPDILVRAVDAKRQQMAPLTEETPPLVEHENLYLLQEPEYDIAQLLDYDFRPAALSATMTTLEDMTHCGVQNLGNTCYANALLNAISKIPLCRSWFATHQHRFESDAAHQHTCMLCKVANDVTRICTLPLNAPFAPEAVLARAHWNDSRSFDNFDQHDANEGFQALLHACNACDEADFLHTELVPRIPRNTSLQHTTPYWHIFGSKAKETLRCQHCPRVVISHSPHTSFSLALPLHGRHTIEHLFAETLGNEPIEGACPRCKHENCRTKATELVTKPRVLALHLKRWDFIRARRRAEKILTPVDFEMLLPLDATTTYELCSVVVHRGVYGGGHYIAFVRAQDHTWYHCDDAKAPRPCSTEEVMAAQAYMLFYQRL